MPSTCTLEHALGQRQTNVSFFLYSKIKRSLNLYSNSHILFSFVSYNKPVRSSDSLIRLFVCRVQRSERAVPIAHGNITHNAIVFFVILHQHDERSDNRCLRNTLKDK